MMKTVTFKNKNIDVSATIRFPKDFDENKTYAAIVCAHPISSCKEESFYGTDSPNYVPESLK